MLNKVNVDYIFSNGDFIFNKSWMNYVAPNFETDFPINKETNRGSFINIDITQEPKFKYV